MYKSSTPIRIRLHELVELSERAKSSTRRQFWKCRNIFLIKLFIFTPFYSVADVVNEYREKNTDGYIAGTYLFGSDEPGESHYAGEFYGEYDIFERLSLTGRFTYGAFETPAEEDSPAKTKNISIVSTGVRFNYPIFEKFNVGAKTNVVYRDYNDIKGLSYRFMPIIQFDPVEALNLRYIYEFDYIPKSSIKDSPFDFGSDAPVRKNRLDQETALYIRLMPLKMIDDDERVRLGVDGFGFAYELKMATGVKDIEFSYENNLYLTFDNGLGFKASRVYSDGDLEGYDIRSYLSVLEQIPKSLTQRPTTI